MCQQPAPTTVSTSPQLSWLEKYQSPHTVSSCRLELRRSSRAEVRGEASGDSGQRAGGGGGAGLLAGVTLRVRAGEAARA